MKPYVFHLEDGSTLFEWVSRDYRFGITIERDAKESGWYFVSKSGVAEHGELPEELLLRLTSSTDGVARR